MTVAGLGVIGLGHADQNGWDNANKQHRQADEDRESNLGKKKEISNCFACAGLAHRFAHRRILFSRNCLFDTLILSVKNDKVKNPLP